MDKDPKITEAIPPDDSNGEREKIAEVLEIGEDGMTEYERSLAEHFLPRYIETDIPNEERRDCEKEVAELLAMFVDFEARYHLADLYAITDLTPADAPKHPIREPAKKALIPVLKRWNALKKETNISKERLDELYEGYRKLYKAEGNNKNGKVRHS